MSTSSEPKSAPRPPRLRTPRKDLGFDAPVAFAVLALLPATALAASASVSVDGGAVILGRTESAKVLVRVDEPQAAGDGPIRLSVNVGSFSEPERVGPGQYRAVYSPPATRFPQMALVAVWRETGPEARAEFARFPLLGTTRLGVKAPAGSAVSAKVGAEQFGPVTAGARGEAVLPIVVPPGVREATVSISGESGAVVRTVALEVPPYNRLAAAVVPGTAVADGKAQVRLDVFYEGGGAEVPAGRLRVSASEGQVRLAEAGGGRYSYRYVAPAGPSAGEVRFQVAVEGDPAAAARARLALVAPMPKGPPASADPLPRPAPPKGPVAPAPSAAPSAAPAPLPVDRGRLHAGPRAGFVWGAGDASGLRLGVDAWIPVRVGPLDLGLGLACSHGSASRTVADPSGSLRSTSSADFFPLEVRLGYEVWAGHGISFTAGPGFTAAFALFTSAVGGTATGLGAGPLGFVEAGYALGPGRIFVEASASRVPVSASGYRLEAGGLDVEGGYRLRVF